ncbi:NAD-dependent epimerase/dehydratase family protein [Lacticaseibacillus pabuli]|uniref:NAD-dependent epimerase/dehydratase family protein n=1 Tax=Lacticaseibacillus pabuli TaxID=3025672 RepID=A0ABY7WPT4_9LACO|nr:NAD-dependent epimerase/dehydratase family protein [Lacticaseibacillus sp. KACC 23028]WDF82126.1 NAD-dependent epimerase/dehydratase family protein [Lacticaseibacillus sp. KACC 23028]
MTQTILVTGANGFLAMHIIKDLLIKGYNVRGTVRSQAKADEVTAAMKANKVAHPENLSFVMLDLTKDAGWDDALAGVDGVMSVAAPVFVNGEKTSDAMANTATEGTLRILKAAEKAGVKRVVMTGNFGAVGFSNLDPNRTTTEADWTDPDQPGLSLYERSKLIAERAAWDYMTKSSSGMELVTVNAGAMLGTALDSHVSGSFGIIKNLFTGRRLPNLPFTVVAADDVAAMHVLAMAEPKAAGHRFLAVADHSIDYKTIKALIRAQRPALAGKLSNKAIPNWLLSVLAPFNKDAREANNMLHLSRKVSNAAARNVLGWQPKFTAEAAVLAAVDELAKNKAI